jgi:hypothetical protein
VRSADQRQQHESEDEQSPKQQQKVIVGADRFLESCARKDARNVFIKSEVQGKPSGGLGEPGRKIIHSLALYGPDKKVIAAGRRLRSAWCAR